MAMKVSEITEWLDGRGEDDLIGVDDGGLCLQVVGDEDYYLEIGGLPEDENIPCIKCGRTDLPLFTNYQCAECGPGENKNE